MCNGIWWGFSKDNETKTVTNSHSEWEKYKYNNRIFFWRFPELLDVWTSTHKHKQLILLSYNPLIWEVLLVFFTSLFFPGAFIKLKFWIVVARELHCLQGGRLLAWHLPGTPSLLYLSVFISHCSTLTPILYSLLASDIWGHLASHAEHCIVSVSDRYTRVWF